MKSTQIITQFFRYFVALTFIFSGFVKLVDPVGTKIKLLEYFGDDVLNLTFLNEYALTIGIFLIIAEFGLGVWLLFGLKPKQTMILLLLTITVFLFLTWYSAYYNKVTDCGCFGDAVKLSTWQTFYKNVVLFVMIVWLLKYHNQIKHLFSEKTSRYLAFFVYGLGVFLMKQSFNHLPIIDFRPYAIGKNIPEGMIIPEGAEQAKFEDIWYYKVNGEVKEFTNEQAPWEIEGAEFVDRKTTTLSEGYTPPIHDFSIENDEKGDITDEVLKAAEIYLIISSNPDELDEKRINQTNKFVQKLKAQNKKVIGMFSQYDDDLKAQFDFELFLTDETTLKTMVRSNPGLVKLQNGTVVDKKSWRDFE
jgi:uncharacterized membrane protein YphA (DoxX/SURF4 family)